jgi:hypothetical protein
MKHWYYAAPCTNESCQKWIALKYLGESVHQPDNLPSVGAVNSITCLDCGTRSHYTSGEIAILSSDHQLPAPGE